MGYLTKGTKQTIKMGIINSKVYMTVKSMGNSYRKLGRKHHMPCPIKSLTFSGIIEVYFASAVTATCFLFCFWAAVAESTAGTISI